MTHEEAEVPEVQILHAPLVKADLPHVEPAAPVKSKGKEAVDPVPGQSN